jgi:hypothetical protein
MGTVASTHPPWGDGKPALDRKILAAQLATLAEPMSFDATAAEQTLPKGPMRTERVTFPLSDESCARALL